MSADWDDEPGKPQARMKNWQMALIATVIVLVFVAAAFLD